MGSPFALVRGIQKEFHRPSHRRSLREPNIFQQFVSFLIVDGIERDRSILAFCLNFFLFFFIFFFSGLVFFLPASPRFVLRLALLGVYVVVVVVPQELLHHIVRQFLQHDFLLRDCLQHFFQLFFFHAVQFSQVVVVVVALLVERILVRVVVHLERSRPHRRSSSP